MFVIVGRISRRTGKPLVEIVKLEAHELEAVPPGVEIFDHRWQASKALRSKSNARPPWSDSIELETQSLPRCEGPWCS